MQRPQLLNEIVLLSGALQTKCDIVDKEFIAGITFQQRLIMVSLTSTTENIP